MHMSNALPADSEASSPGGVSGQVITGNSQWLSPDEDLSGPDAMEDNAYISKSLQDMGIKESNCNALLGFLSSVEQPIKTGKMEPRRNQCDEGAIEVWK